MIIYVFELCTSVSNITKVIASTDLEESNNVTQLIEHSFLPCIIAYRCIDDFAKNAELSSTRVP